MAVPIRRAAMRLHLWLGLWLGALFVLQGLTGSVLVWYVEIDALLHPQQASAGMATPAGWDRAIATLRRDHPAWTGPWRLEVTGRPGPIPARYYGKTSMDAGRFAPPMAWLSPDGARVLRRDRWGDHAMTWIYDLHYRLLLGPTAGTVLGYVSLALAVLLFTGLAAWWPKGSWKKALLFKRGAPPLRALRDWHKLAGLGGLPLLAMLAVTGAALELPKETGALLTTLLGRAPGVPVPESDVQADWSAPTIPPSKAAAAALAALPSARLAWIEAPGPGHTPYRLRLQLPGDPSRRFPHSWVLVDQHSGRVLSVADATRSGAQVTVLNWLHPLHDGSAGGMPLRAALVLAGLMPLALFTTGWLRWRRRKARVQNDH
ncbi:PepSY-associated TM helix domain-containing protein [Novosphingobium cyanobacteriorum]|uniref:PepSY-associated TM helix domain-containing protein n=1 Tax=Novosphingobium cyanobacteriorum TaxID=3024215 RepID=A0ABT6CKV5_9SPHN|nr:PepSY-associated TM helix domain-containing protein [Novosphingobium cyanobacteriorum]MDF8334467.1 PepSY-associated TM helix domain-containing protein [Novosphingobium cyanobacteriorum]